MLQSKAALLFSVWFLSITVGSGRSSNVPRELSPLISESLPDPLNARCRAEIGSFMAPFICLIIIIPLWSTTWKRFGDLGEKGKRRRRRPRDEMPSHCGETNVSSCFFPLKPPLVACLSASTEYIFHELFGDKGFFSSDCGFPLFLFPPSLCQTTTILMVGH